MKPEHDRGVRVQRVVRWLARVTGSDKKIREIAEMWILPNDDDPNSLQGQSYEMRARAREWLGGEWD